MLIATAGHIDHGKTSLVRALTGVETDRLPEEKARGISIDLGFAYWQAEPGITVGFVDVPGHERFVRNMLAGVSSVDFALLVVAADDGIMPQTVEHLEILDLLQIRHGVVAITKLDRVSAERLADVEKQVRALLSAKSLAGAPLRAVSSLTGEGIDELAAQLRQAAADHRENAQTSPREFRFAIDHAFSVTGAGSVVTGTVLDGQVVVGDRLVLMPEGRVLRVRGLHRAGIAVGRADAGERCAINIAGIELASLHRGDWLRAPAMSRASHRISARIAVPKGQERTLRHNSHVHLHLGTADIVARVLIRSQRDIAAGTNARVHLVLDAPTSCCTGDRLVIRDAAGRRTLGGGQVIDPFAKGRRATVSLADEVSAAFEAGAAKDSVNALLAISGHEIDVAHLALCLNLSEANAIALCLDGGAEIMRTPDLFAIASAHLCKARKQIAAEVSAFHSEKPDATGISVPELRRRLSVPLSSTVFRALIRDMATAGILELAGSLVKTPGHAARFSPADSALWNRVLAWLEDRGMAAFTVSDLVGELGTSEAAAKAMVYRRAQSGDIWRITDKRLMLRAQVAMLAAYAAQLDRSAEPSGFSAAQFRDAAGVGRTLTIQVLEFLDSIGVTRRRGDLRRACADYTEIVGTSPPQE